MLVITRRIDESIVIGAKFTTTVLETGNTIRLGIDASRDIDVHREEVFQRILDKESGQILAHEPKATAVVG